MVGFVDLTQKDSAQPEIDTKSTGILQCFAGLFFGKPIANNQHKKGHNLSAPLLDVPAFRRTSDDLLLHCFRHPGLKFEVFFTSELLEGALEQSLL